VRGLHRGTDTGGRCIWALRTKSNAHAVGRRARGDLGTGRGVRKLLAVAEHRGRDRTDRRAARAAAVDQCG
jgi:hypothetical protein